MAHPKFSPPCWYLAFFPEGSISEIHMSNFHPHSSSYQHYQVCHSNLGLKIWLPIGIWQKIHIHLLPSDLDKSSLNRDNSDFLTAYISEETPQLFSPQPCRSFSGSDHRKSQSQLISGTSCVS